MRTSFERVGTTNVNGTPLTDSTAATDPDPLRLGPPGHRIPLLLQKDIITPAEAEKLFKMYSFFLVPSPSPPDFLLATLTG